MQSTNNKQLNTTEKCCCFKQNQYNANKTQQLNV